MVDEYICVYGAASDDIDDCYFAESGRLGSEIAKRGYSLVYGGGSTGVMGALASSVTEAGGKIVGIAPSFFKSQGVLYDKCDDFIYPEDMRKRKELLEKHSVAFIAAPGGVGTLDEFFEILTLKQLGRHNKAIVILNVNGCYDALVALLDTLIENRFAGKELSDLYKVCTDAESALDYIDHCISDNR